MDTAEARDLAKMSVTLLIVTLVIAAAITLLATILRYFNTFHERALSAPRSARNERMLVLDTQSNADGPIPVQTVRNVLAEYNTMDLWYIGITIKLNDVPDPIVKYYTYESEADFIRNYNANVDTPLDTTAVTIVSADNYVEQAAAALNHYGNNLCIIDYNVSDVEAIPSLEIEIQNALAGV